MSDGAAAHLIRFELAMLAELGFGLDLEVCAATGATTELDLRVAEIRRRGVAQRRRAVPRPAVAAAGLLRQSEDGAAGWTEDDLRDGFALTGLFLLRHVLEPRGQTHSDARDGFINAVTSRTRRGFVTPQ